MRHQAEAYRKFVQDILNNVDTSQEMVDIEKEKIKIGLRKKYGTKREIEIPKKFLDVEGKITANITGELKNKSAILQSLDGIFKTVMSTFNPQTGQFAASEDPTLSQIFYQILELSGIPISSSMLKTGLKSNKTQSSEMPDMSAIKAQPISSKMMSV